MKFKVFILVFSLLIVSSCATFETGKYTAESFPSVNPANVSILHNFPPDPTTYRRIGEVSSRAEDSSQWSSIYKRLRQEAGNMGGDAVVLQSEREAYDGYSGAGGGSDIGKGGIWGKTGDIKKTKKIVGIVIRFR